jgi:hypothetical protein
MLGFKKVNERNLAHLVALGPREAEMSCQSCQSENQSNFNGEIAVHFPGLEGLEKPFVWVFPRLLVCLDCGFTEFTIPETELRVLRDGTVSSAVA